jgi:hypothetical protein
MVTFRVGSTDAEILAKEFAPTFVEEDLVNLPKFHTYLKLMIDGVASRPFSALTLPPIGSATDSADKVIRVSRERYAVPREKIEDKIMRWSGMITLPNEDVASLEVDEDEAVFDKTISVAPLDKKITAEVIVSKQQTKEPDNSVTTNKILEVDDSFLSVPKVSTPKIVQTISTPQFSKSQNNQSNLNNFKAGNFGKKKKRKKKNKSRPPDNASVTLLVDPKQKRISLSQIMDSRQNHNVKPPKENKDYANTENKQSQEKLQPQILDIGLSGMSKIIDKPQAPDKLNISESNLGFVKQNTFSNLARPVVAQVKSAQLPNPPATLVIAKPLNQSRNTPQPRALKTVPLGKVVRVDE